MIVEAKEWASFSSLLELHIQCYLGNYNKIAAVKDIASILKYIIIMIWDYISS